MIDFDTENVIPSITPFGGDEGLHCSPSSLPFSSDVVIAEIPVDNTTLHKIATGQCRSIGCKGEMFAVRFLLKDSFKARQSNYVVNRFVMQILAVGKGNAFKVEDIAVKTKVQTVQKIVEKKKVENITFKIDTTKKEMF
jgi:hypothetical protein